MSGLTFSNSPPSTYLLFGDLYLPGPHMLISGARVARLQELISVIPLSFPSIDYLIFPIPEVCSQALDFWLRVRVFIHDGNLHPLFSHWNWLGVLKPNVPDLFPWSILNDLVH